MAKVAIIGTGRFATALGFMLNQLGHKVSYFGRTRSSTQRCQDLLPRFKTPGVEINAFYKKPNNVRSFQLDISQYDWVIIGTSLDGLGWAIERIRPGSSTPIVLVQKGLDGELQSPGEIAKKAWPTAPILLFTGALFAKDLINKDVYDHPERYGFGMIVGHFAEEELARNFVSLWENSPIWPVTCPLPTSISLHNAIRTVASMAMGIVAGYTGPENTSTAALVRAAIVQEAWRLAKALGAGEATLDRSRQVWRVLQADIDLCHDPTSRNNQLGQLIGQGVPFEKARLQVAQNGVMESIQNATVLASALAKTDPEWQQSFPYLAGVWEITQGQDIQQVAKNLLARRQRYFSNVAP